MSRVSILWLSIRLPPQDPLPGMNVFYEGTQKRGANFPQRLKQLEAAGVGQAVGGAGGESAVHGPGSTAGRAQSASSLRGQKRKLDYSSAGFR